MLQDAQLQAAMLQDAQLQGASLDDAQLQGASLQDAQLQGASLEDAQLQGASLDDAQLQGASLVHAQLQGASLHYAFLWRAHLQLSMWKDVFADFLDWAPEQGQPVFRPCEPSLFNCEPERQGWTDATYAELRQSIKRVAPLWWRFSSLGARVAILDCSRKTAKRWEVQGWGMMRGRGSHTLASCDPSAESPDEVKQWKKMIEVASVDKVAYAKALAAILRDLVCAKGPNRIEVLRGLLRSDRFQETGSEMPGVASLIMSAECTVSTALTDADKRDIAKASTMAVSWARPRAAVRDLRTVYPRHF
jgi:hypothetical protein